VTETTPVAQVAFSDLHDFALGKRRGEGADALLKVDKRNNEDNGPEQADRFATR
jgi:hypothetical protein